MIEAAGQDRLVKIIRQLWDSSDPYRTMYFSDGDNRKLVQQEHRAILKAVRDRDEDQLIALLNEHRDHAGNALGTVLDDDVDD